MFPWVLWVILASHWTEGYKLLETTDMYPVINSIKSGEFSGTNITKFVVKAQEKEGNDM